MSRTPLPFVAQDMSALARFLQRELESLDKTPGHVQLLNMLARATGYRNFQHYRAQHAAQARLEQPSATETPVDYRAVERTAGHFDDRGRLKRWPARPRQQTLCLWVLWSKFPKHTVMTEREVNDLLNAHHLFADPATLRRLMVGHKMLTRTRDGSAYERLEQRPPDEAVALIRHLGQRQPIAVER